MSDLFSLMMKSEETQKFGALIAALQEIDLGEVSETFRQVSAQAGEERVTRFMGDLEACTQLAGELKRTSARLMMSLINSAMDLGEPS